MPSPHLLPPHLPGSLFAGLDVVELSQKRCRLQFDPWTSQSAYAKCKDVSGNSPRKEQASNTMGGCVSNCSQPVRTANSGRVSSCEEVVFVVPGVGGVMMGCFYLITSMRAVRQLFALSLQPSRSYHPLRKRDRKREGE